MINQRSLGSHRSPIERTGLSRFAFENLLRVSRDVSAHSATLQRKYAKPLTFHGRIGELKIKLTTAFSYVLIFTQLSIEDWLKLIGEGEFR